MTESANEAMRLLLRFFAAQQRKSNLRSQAAVMEEEARELVNQYTADLDSNVDVLRVAVKYMEDSNRRTSNYLASIKALREGLEKELSEL